LRVGAGIGGLSLPCLLAARANASLNEAVKPVSVILLNLQGGPSQFETFDPKVQAPREIRSLNGATQTNVPGIAYGADFPMLAARADRMSVVRSYRHGISSHGPAAMHVMAGGNATKAMMGALYSQVAGLSNRERGLPNNVLVTSRAMGDQYKHLYYNSDRVSQTGELPSAYRPFDPSAGSELVANMRLNVDADRLFDRRSLLHQLDAFKRQTDRPSFETSDRFQRQAFDVLARGVADAFDLSNEDQRWVERYDTGELEPSEAIKRRNSYAKQFSPVALGKQLLLARRLCESGCGFVTVTCPGWDMHGGGKEFRMDDGIGSLAPAVDKAVSALLDDLRHRDLDQRILLVITGEFGRTPRINKNGGRDHWGNLCTLAFAGGGLRMGQAVGRSDRNGGVPSSDPISSSQVLATVMHAMLDIGKVRLMSGLAKNVERAITAGSPIKELV